MAMVMVVGRNNYSFFSSSVDNLLQLKRDLN
jgi:hypothetical protein